MELEQYQEQCEQVESMDELTLMKRVVESMGRHMSILSDLQKNVIRPLMDALPPQEPLPPDQEAEFQASLHAVHEEQRRREEESKKRFDACNAEIELVRQHFRVMVNEYPEGTLFSYSMVLNDYYERQHKAEIESSLL